VAVQWFSLRYGAFSRWLLTALASGPGRSGIAVDEADFAVEMGVSFGGRAPLRSVSSVRPLEETVAVTRGVHGWRGDWLVNGAGDGLVEVTFEPPMKAHVLGVPIRIRRLRISVDDPAGFASALHGAAGV
jgi:hypothetical protein